MTRRVRECPIDGCTEPASRYSHSLCPYHEAVYIEERRVKYENSPKGRARAALYKCGGDASIRAWLDTHVVERMEDGS